MTIPTTEPIIINCKQGTPPWLQARAGIHTASNFHLAKSRYVSGKQAGEYKADAIKYARQKAVERISGVPIRAGFITHDMRYGQEHEPAARRHHEVALAQRNLPMEEAMIEECGIVLTPDRRFGASVDGIIGMHGGSEYKCFTDVSKIWPIMFENDIGQVMDQVQGSMWVTQRRWWHFGLYCPDLRAIGLEFKLIEIERDDDYIEELELELMKFKKLIDKEEAALRSLGAHAISEVVAEAVKAMQAPEVEQDEVF